MKTKTIYIIQATSFINHPSIDTVILANENIDVLNNLIVQYENKVRHLHYYGQLENLDQLHPGFKGLIKVFPKTKAEVIKVSNILKKRRCMVCPRFPIKKVEDISFITSMGIPVDLLYRIDMLEKTVSLEILEFYLHHRALEVPVEPFHTILLSKMKKDKLHLWDLQMVFPHRYFYMDDHGIAATPEDMKRKRYLFTIDKESGEWLKTGKENTLDTYLKNFPAKYPECLSCEHFHWCFTWAKYKKDSCEKWKAILNQLQEAAREIEEAKKVTQ